MRDCGDCVACCVYLRINAPTLKKAACTHCPHLSLSEEIKPNTMQLTSQEPVKCQIYDSKPNVCSDYKCLWLMGVGAGEDRPDKSGILMDTLHQIENAIECKPLFPDGEDDPRVQATIRRAIDETGKAAIVTSFYERSIVRVVT